MSLILVMCIKQEKYCDIERAAGAPAKISRIKIGFKRFNYKKEFFLEHILLKIQTNYV